MGLGTSSVVKVRDAGPSSEHRLLIYLYHKVTVTHGHTDAWIGSQPLSIHTWGKSCGLGAGSHRAVARAAWDMREVGQNHTERCCREKGRE